MFRLMAIVLLVVTFVGINFLEGQKMDEERTMKMLKDFVALKHGEVPDFDAKAIVHRVNLKERGKGDMTRSLKSSLKSLSRIGM
jgi:hypothetical protein